MLNVKKYKHLQFINFEDFIRWNYNSYFKAKSIESKYKAVELREVLKQSNQYENLKKDKGYNLLGIRSYGGGCFFREKKFGLDIKAKKLNKIFKKQFIYSRLGAGFGSFDIINDEFNNFYVSNEFPAFDIDSNQLYPDFLKSVFSIPYYTNHNK